MTAEENRFTRVSVLGQYRNADIVIPSNAPIDLVMTQIAQVLGEDVRQSHALARAGGGALRPAASLAEEGITDGTILQLTLLDHTPPAPTVFDLSEATEMASGSMRGRWTDGVRSGGLALIATLAFSAALPLLLAALALDAGWTFAAGGLTLVALGSALWSLGGREAGRVLAAGGAVLGAVAALPPVSGTGTLPVPWLVALSIAGLAGLGTARRRTTWIAGLVTLGLVTGAWYLTFLITDSAFRTAGITGTLALLVLGVMPQAALASSGIFSAQRRSSEMPRATADELVTRAHGTLAGSVSVLGVAIAVCVGQVLLDPEVNAWGAGLAVALATGAALRQRPFPLAPEKIALWTPVLALAFTGTLLLTRFDPGWIWVGVVALVVLAIALLVVAHAPVPEHVRAQFRMFGDSLETLAVVVTIPLAVGMFGLYATLLGVLS